jgi:adenine-specific DNA-methyltransferase
MTEEDEALQFWNYEVVSGYRPDADAVIASGDCLETLRGSPGEFAKLIITSPPYNLGKAYEKATELNLYLDALRPIVDEMMRILSPEGSLCWQVGNYVEKGEVFPLDIFYYRLFKERGFKLRNRIIWHFEHGLHASKRFSGRYETLLWFTKGDAYTFNLDPVRVPAKYLERLISKARRRGSPPATRLGRTLPTSGASSPKILRPPSGTSRTSRPTTRRRPLRACPHQRRRLGS